MTNNNNNITNNDNFITLQQNFIKEKIIELLNYSGYSNTEKLTNFFFKKLNSYDDYIKYCERQAQLNNRKFSIPLSNYPDYDYAAGFIGIDQLWLHSRLDMFGLQYYNQNNK
jgi:hypothetical protein